MDLVRDYNRQAAVLRELVLARRRAAGSAQARGLTLVGAAAGCGTTTLAVNLAATLAVSGGSAVVLLDAVGQGGPCDFLGIEPPATLADVARGRAPLARAIAEGPEGLWVVASGAVFERRDGLTPWQRQQLRRALDELAKRSAFVVAESSVAAAPPLATLGEVAVVGAPWAVVETYSTLKLCAEAIEATRLGVIVGRASSRLQATKTTTAIAAVAGRRLGFEPPSLGFVAEDPYVGTAAQERTLFAVDYPRCQAARCLKSIAARLRAGAPPVPSRPGQRVSEHDSRDTSSAPQR